MPADHAQSGRVVHRHGRRGHRYVPGAHVPAGDVRNAEVEAVELRQHRRAVQTVLSPVHRAVPVCVHRQHAEIRHGGRAELRQPAVLQRAVLPRAGHPADRRVHLQAPARAHGERLGRSDETQAVRPDHRRNHGRHRRGCRRHDARDGMDRHPGDELSIRRGLRAVPRTVLHHAGRRRRDGGHRLLVPGDHRAAPTARRNEAVRDHVRIRAVRAHPAGEFHGAARRRDWLPYRDDHPVRASDLGVPAHPHGAVAR